MAVQSLCIDPKGYLYAGTDVSGIFKSKDRFGTTTHGGAAVGQRNSSTTVSLGPCFPNPVSTVSSIPFFLPQKGEIKVDITDLLGRRVALLIDGIYEMGEHSTIFDTKGLSAGGYYVRLQAQGTSIVKPVIVK